VLKKAHNI